MSLKNQGVKGQPIRQCGPESHNSKQGTPTMGGLSIIIAIVLSTILFADITNLNVLLVIFILLSYACLGFIDDWKKVTKQNTKGVSGRTKLIVQGLLAVIFGVVLVLMANFKRH